MVSLEINIISNGIKMSFNREVDSQNIRSEMEKIMSLIELSLSKDSGKSLHDRNV